MSIHNLKRARLKNETDSRAYHIVHTSADDPYWDEGLVFYPRVTSKIYVKWKKKRILRYQVRMYQTWKHNRKTQYKMKINHIESFVKRLNKIGIEVELVGNYPWVYLVKVNGKTVEGKYQANHGFTAFFLTKNSNNPYEITDTKIVFAKIREMIQ